MNKPLMDILEVQNYLPHRYPFLMIDQVLEIRDNQSIIALKNVSVNEPHFQGHIPTLPVMPGVLLIETMAQAAGILGFHIKGSRAKDGMLFYLVGVDNVRFKVRVMPGDQLIVYAEVLKQRQDVWKFKTEVRVQDELACSAEIMLAKGPSDHVS